MKNIYILIVIFIVLGLLYYKKVKTENLESDLREPAHLPATIQRQTNTILTATAAFSDAMDKLPLPPEIVDSYNEWIEKGLVSPIKDQMLCGGCWAFATCATLADRLAIATAGKWYAPFGLSDQVLISCGGDMGMDYYQGCGGGIPSFAIEALAKEGVPEDIKCTKCSGSGAGQTGGGGGGGVVNPNNSATCSSGGNVYGYSPYTWWQTGCDGSTSCSLSPASTCPCAGISAQMQQITGTTPLVKYRTVGQAHSYTSHGPNNEMKTVDLWPDIPQSVITANVERMKKAIYYEGPITVAYRVTQDFYTFWPTSSVDNYYKYDGRSPMAGGHAVVVVGWKKMSDGTPVWIVKNSWGANGGYGFPNGPKWKDPMSGQLVEKYKGGFWNHIMGINDSFIESNSAGAHPDLTIPEIAAFIPQKIAKNWNETMTLRDIYLMSEGQPIPTPQPQPTPTPQPQPTPTPVPPPVPEEPLPVFDSDTFKTVSLTPNNISTQSIQEFFSTNGSLYMIGANDPNNIYKIMRALPNKPALSESDLNALINTLSANTRGSIVIAARGDLNNYYYLDGDPVDWVDIFSRDYLQRAATMRKFANDINIQLGNLLPQAPIVQLSKK